MILPEIFPNNKSWHRGGSLSQKRHVEMTEEEKTHIAKCEGIKNNHPCKNPVFRCEKCGNYGCAQEVADKCTNQGFKNDKCLKCGALESRIPVMEEDLFKVMTQADKEF